MNASFDFDPEKTFVGAKLPGSTKHPCLLVVASPEADELGLQFILLSSQVNIGRQADCAIYLKDQAISRRHATLSVINTPSGPLLNISNFTHPEVLTLIGNQTLSPNVTGTLRLGDRLQLGNTVLQYILFEHEPQLTTYIHNVSRLIREAQYERALSGLAGIKKHRPAGGVHLTSLEQLLLSAKYHEARLHAIQGKWGRAIELFGELSRRENPASDLRVKAAFQLGTLYVHQNDLVQAQRTLDQVWKLAESMNGYFMALVLCLHGMVGARRRDFSFAEKAFRDAMIHLKESTSPALDLSTQNLSARIHLELAVASFLTEQQDLALSQFERLSSETSRTGTHSHRVIGAEALRYRGIIHSVRREFEQADYLLRESLRIFQETKWKFLECKAQKSRALNYLSWGRLEEATVHLQACQRLLSTEVENDYERAVAAAQLGKVYLTRGNAQEALRSFEHERELQAGIAGVEHSQAYTHRNFARAHRNLGHADEATRYYVRAAEAFEEFSNHVQQGLTLVELCGLRLESGDAVRAKDDLTSAEHCFRVAGRGQSFEPTLNALRARLAWVTGEYAQALTLFSSSIRALETSPPSYFLGETYLLHGRLCAEIYRRETNAGNTSVASEFYRQAKLLFDKGIKCAASQSLGYLLEQFRREIEALDPKEFIKLILSRFVSTESLDQIITDSFQDLNRFQIEERTVIFVDLSGYTAMVEKEDLSEVRDILNEFYGFATRIIHQHGGSVDKFIGDCVMAIFKGTTIGMGLQNQAVAAVSATLAISEEVEHLSERRFPGTRRLAASAGVCTGKLLLGLVGSLQHMNYTCIGDVVNVAARLQGLAQRGQVFISSETHKACMQGGIVLWTDGGRREAHVKNREQPVYFWSLDRETRKILPSPPR